MTITTDGLNCQTAYLHRYPGTYLGSTVTTLPSTPDLVLSKQKDRGGFARRNAEVAGGDITNGPCHVVTGGHSDLVPRPTSFSRFCTLPESLQQSPIRYLGRLH